MTSDFKTVDQYIASFPSDVQETLSQTRAMILANIDPIIEETMNWGMIAYEIPFSVVPKTYNNKPLLYMALARQKHHYSLYVNFMYGDDAQAERLKSAYDELGLKLNIGKCCIRFVSIDKIPMDVIADMIKNNNAKKFIEYYHRCHRK